jgi:hypothetical protein
LQLALEKIHNDAIVALLVPFPALLAQFGELGRPASGLPVGLLDVRLLLDPVEVLVQPVE